MLLDNHGYDINCRPLVNARELTKRMYHEVMKENSDLKEFAIKLNKIYLDSRDQFNKLLNDASIPIISFYLGLDKPYDMDKLKQFISKDVSTKRVNYGKAEDIHRDAVFYSSTNETVSNEKQLKQLREELGISTKNSLKTNLNIWFDNVIRKRKQQNNNG
jgi:hypothetical protein